MVVTPTRSFLLVDSTIFSLITRNLTSTGAHNVCRRSATNDEFNQNSIRLAPYHDATPTHRPLTSQRPPRVCQRPLGGGGVVPSTSRTTSSVFHNIGPRAKSGPRGIVMWPAQDRMTARAFCKASSKSEVFCRYKTCLENNSTYRNTTCVRN